MWEDDFKYNNEKEVPAGSIKDFTDKWVLMDREDNYGSEYFKPNQVRILSQQTHPSGVLRLEAHLTGKADPFNKKETVPQHESYKKNVSSWKKYRSGAIRSKRTETPSSGYGILEIRAKLPTGTIGVDDIWPALWYYSREWAELDLIDGIIDGKKLTMGILNWRYAPLDKQTPFWDYLGWLPALPEGCKGKFDFHAPYASGDVVFLKERKVVTGKETRIEYQCCRRKGNDVVQGKGIVYHYDQNGNEARDFSQDFYTYAVAWSKEKIIFYINNKEIYSVDNTVYGVQPAQKEDGSFVQNGEIILSLQSKWGADVESDEKSTTFKRIKKTPMVEKAYMDIDFVRWYAPK